MLLRRPSSPPWEEGEEMLRCKALVSGYWFLVVWLFVKMPFGGVTEGSPQGTSTITGFCPRLIALNSGTALSSVTCIVGRGDSLALKSVRDMLAGFIRTVVAALCDNRSIGVGGFNMFDLSTHATNMLSMGRYATGGVGTIGVGFQPSDAMEPSVTTAHTKRGVSFCSLRTLLGGKSNRKKDSNDNSNSKSKNNSSKSRNRGPLKWM